MLTCACTNRCLRSSIENGELQHVALYEVCNAAFPPEPATPKEVIVPESPPHSPASRLELPLHLPHVAHSSVIAVATQSQPSGAHFTPTPRTRTLAPTQIVASGTPSMPLATHADDDDDDDNGDNGDQQPDRNEQQATTPQANAKQTNDDGQQAEQEEALVDATPSSKEAAAAAAAAFSAATKAAAAAAVDASTSSTSDGGGGARSRRRTTFKAPTKVSAITSPRTARLAAAKRKRGAAASTPTTSAKRGARDSTDTAATPLSTAKNVKAKTPTSRSKTSQEQSTTRTRRSSTRLSPVPQQPTIDVDDDNDDDDAVLIEHSADAKAKNVTFEVSCSVLFCTHRRASPIQIVSRL
jgi:hypothetical protein